MPPLPSVFFFNWYRKKCKIWAFSWFLPFYKTKLVISFIVLKLCMQPNIALIFKIKKTTNFTSCHLSHIKMSLALNPWVTSGWNVEIEPRLSSYCTFCNTASYWPIMFKSKVSFISKYKEFHMHRLNQSQIKSSRKTLPLYWLRTVFFLVTIPKTM